MTRAGAMVTTVRRTVTVVRIGQRTGRKTMAEKEYIEREKALDSLLGWAERLTETYGKNDEYVLCLQSAAYNIEQIPAADVRPVVKARWVYTDMSRLVCSNCGNPVTFALKDDGWHHGDYCPNCGARMEES